jgi:hypothetical protein
MLHNVLFLSVNSKIYLKVKLFPIAVHVNFTAFPRFTVWFLGACVISGGP